MPVTLNGEKATIVDLALGPGMDCLLGCIYKKYFVLVVGKDIIEIPPEPDTRGILSQYSSWCMIDLRQIKNIKRAITTSGDKYNWSYEFDNFTNKDIRLKMHSENELYKADGNSQYCIYNGTLHITNVDESGNATAANDSNFEVTTSPLLAR